MAVLANQLTFRKIQGALPAFGDTYEDITRAGATALRLAYIGKRAARSSVTAHMFVRTLPAARSSIAQIEGKKGTDLTLIEELTNNQWTVFLHDVTCEWRKIESTETNANYQVVARMDLTRTE